MKVFVFLLLIPAVLGTGGMVGGYAYASLSEPETQRMAKVSLRELNKKENSVRKLVEIVSAKTQVVAGVNYNFVLHVKNGEQDEICEVTLYAVQWLHQTTLTHDECKLTKRKVGAEEPASEAEVKEAVLLATDYHNVKLNSLFREGAQGVENIKKQTVAGILYTFTVNFMPTHCFNDGTSLGKGLDECPVNKDGTETKCTYKVLFQDSMTPKYTVKNETCGEWVPQPVPGVKSEMVTKLKNSLKEHDKPKLNEFMLPNNMLPIANANKELSNHIVPLNRQKKSVDNLQPLMQHIGKSVFEALKNVKKETPEMNDKAKEDLDKLLGKDGHDLVQHGLEKLLGGDGHDLLKHGIEQLLGGDGHDLQKHGLDQLLGGDNHDLVKHGLANLLGGDGHDLKNHGNLIGGDDHDFKKHGSLIGGDDHDFKKHGGLIGGDEHDFKKHGGLIGGDDHDFKKHGGLIGGDDHDLKPHGTKNSAKIGGDDHDLCHLGHFKEFIIKHGKSYETVDEENKRFGIFCENMAFARKLNETEQGTAVYGATKFADLTPMEFRHKYLSKKNWDDIPNHGASKMWRAKIPKGSPPSSFDWRSLGAVTAVKNQGQCGSCWAFSTTGNIEGQWKIKQGNLVSLSEQELVDCDKLDDGCEGGLPSNAYQSIMKLGGLETEGEYKYDGADEKCKFNKTEVAVTITGAVNISQNEADMAAWLAANGPISIGINANAMQFYFGGISHPWKIFCNPASLDHGVLIVGYGTEGSEPFWIVKNSWGPDWGEKGYYRVYRGGGVCGLNRMCTSAVVN